MILGEVTRLNADEVDIVKACPTDDRERKNNHESRKIALFGFGQTFAS